MTLSIYEETSPGVYTERLEYGETDLLPIITTHDGVAGETRDTKLYLRGNNALEYYTSITITPTSLTSPDDTIQTASGWGVKLKLGNERPTEVEWQAISYGGSISFSDVGTSSSGDINSYIPFWCRIVCPEDVSTGVTKTNIVLTVAYTAMPIS